MSVFRLTPLTPGSLRLGHQGQCAACAKPVAGSDVAVRIYGELFHRPCAYYQARGAVRDEEARSA